MGGLSDGTYAVLVLSDEERSYLERQARRRRVARSPSRMILRCADGLTNKAVAAHERRRRFLKERIDGLSDEPRPGRPRTLSDEKVHRADAGDDAADALRSGPGERAVAYDGPADMGGLQRAAAPLGDPLFVDKALSPPDRALALCRRKARSRRSSRTQPVLPMLPGMPERRTHDCVTARPRCSQRCRHRPRHRQVLQAPPGQGVHFLKEIDRRVPEGLDIHIVMDNYATHKTAAVKAWLARRPVHWHIHFTPTSASWINQVERWFAELTRKQLARCAPLAGSRHPRLHPTPSPSVDEIRRRRRNASVSGSIKTYANFSFR